MKNIDLRSDTVTLPTDEMRRAMAQAELGDDVYGEDPTVNSLEQIAAAMLGKEAAILTVSGTMSNLLAILSQTLHGDEVLLGSESHIFLNEVGGASTLGGVVMRTLANYPDGTINLDEIVGAIRSRNIHFPQTTLICLENTQNNCSGAVLTPEYTSSTAELAHQHGLKVHLDGARIFNAAIALGIPVTELVEDVDSVCFCLSKGLGAPVGSLLCGSRDFIESARRWRKMVGGGMRQAGIIAAAGKVALDKMVTRLAEDHENARRLARGLANIPGISLPYDVPSNIVIFEILPAVSGPELVQRLKTKGIRIGYRGRNRYRAVTHYMITADDINEALARIELTLRELLGP